MATLGEVAIFKNALTEQVVHRLSKPKQNDPDLKQVYYKSVGGKVVDEVWREQ